MFNFKLMNKALTDKNVTDSEFRTLCLILNKCSLNKTDCIEMYNSQIMFLLNYSERSAQRCLKGLNDNGYVCVEKATKKKTPNKITLLPIKNDDKNDDKNDTLYNNIYNKDIIHSIQCNVQSNLSFNKLDDIQCIQSYNVNTEQPIESEDENTLDRTSNNLKSDNIDEVKQCNSNVEYTTNVECNTNEVEHSTTNADYYPNEGRDIDALIEAYERGMEEAGKQSTISQPQEKDNPKGIDWDAWRERFEQCKKGILNAKCKTDFDLWRMNCKKSLNYAQEHMRDEKYEKVQLSFDKWYAASEPYFYYYKKQSPMQNTKVKPCKEFDEGQWFSYQCILQYEPEKREQTAHEMVQYAKECGKDTSVLVKELKQQYGIVL